MKKLTTPPARSTKDLLWKPAGLGILESMRTGEVDTSQKIRPSKLQALI
jgi:hypothetical protein